MYNFYKPTKVSELIAVLNCAHIMGPGLEIATVDKTRNVSLTTKNSGLVVVIY